MHLLFVTIGQSNHTKFHGLDTECTPMLCHGSTGLWHIRISESKILVAGPLNNKESQDVHIT